MADQWDAEERSNVSPMRLIRARALAQARLDVTVQQSALDDARRMGDRSAAIYYRNARDRMRGAVRWIQSH